MVDAANPEMPENQTAPLTESQQRFEASVDRAYRQFNTSAQDRGPEPVALLTYAAGQLAGKERVAFERELESKGGVAAVVATMKAARPVKPSAPLSEQLSFTITKNLMQLVTNSRSVTPSKVLRTFSQASHEAYIRSQADDDLRQISDLIDKQDDDQIKNIGNTLTGTPKAIVSAYLGNLEDAHEHWSSNNNENPAHADLSSTISLALNSSAPQSPSSPLSSLCSQLSSASHDSSSLLSILLDFAQAKHRS
jgi:hypothetical protein